MTALLELRENIKRIYSRNEFFLLPVAKFILALIVFCTINARLGYMTRLDNMAIVLIVSLLCSFLPVGFLVFFPTLFILAHTYALSLEAAAVVLIVLLLLYLMFLRFSAKEALVVVLTPILFVWHVPYVMPIAMGLIGTPASAVSVGCGVVVYYLLNTVTSNASTLNTMSSDEATAKLRLIVDGLLANKAMLVTLVAFVVTVMVVYLIRRMSVEHSWTIAMVAGVITQIVILLVGDLIYDSGLSVVGLILGSLVALLAGKILEFFRFCLDYSRTEKVQFEDDEYYYYVKAVPKMTVSAPEKTVKKINQQTAAPRASYGRGDVSEHTGRITRTPQRSSQSRVTITGDGPDEMGGDDYEELF